MDRYVKLNKDIHDNTAESYDKRHIEIYNPHEQLRLSNIIMECRNLINTTSRPIALDYGSGTGNLTQHLLSNSFTVTAADISEKSLRVLSRKFKDQENLNLQIIDGQSLNVFPDNTFDLVSTYSVLHHVPDYLSAIKEFCRVVKPGGLIYIDHEVSPCYWNQSQEYKLYRDELKKSYKNLSKSIRKLYKIFSIKEWKRLYYRFLLKNGIDEEGDIHVHPYDHIEWDKIKNILLQIGEIEKEQDYLVCREIDPKIWKKWKDRCVDMRMIIARKTI